jgi:polar amino acid transport system substrate-binding protein
MPKITRWWTTCAVLVCSPLLSQATHANENLAAGVQRGELKFALTGQFPPFSYVDVSGNLVGFDIDIGDSIAKHLAMTPKPVTTAWDGIIGGLLAGKYAAIIGSMAITEERSKAVDFSEPYYRSGAQLFVRQDSPVRNIDELQGKVIGVTLGETFERWIRTSKPGITLRTYKGLPSILLDLQNKRIDGFVTDKIAGLITIRDKHLDAKPVGNLLYAEALGIAVRKDSPQLKAAINKALEAMFADHTYDAIAIKWLGTAAIR